MPIDTFSAQPQIDNAASRPPKVPFGPKFIEVNDQHLAAFARDISDKAFEQYQAEQDATLRLDVEDKPDPNRWDVEPESHEATPRPDMDVSEPEKVAAIDVAEQIAQLSERQKIDIVLNTGPYIIGTRRATQQANLN